MRRQRLQVPGDGFKHRMVSSIRDPAVSLQLATRRVEEMDMAGSHVELLSKSSLPGILASKSLAICEDDNGITIDGHTDLSFTEDSTVMASASVIQCRKVASSHSHSRKKNQNIRLSSPLVVFS